MDPRSINPTGRDWRDAILFLVMFFLLLAVIDPAPAAVIDAGRDHRERTMDRYLTEAEQARLLVVLKEQAATPLARRDAALIRVLLHSGLRIGECSRVTVGQAMEALRTKYLFIPREDRKGWNRTPKADGTLRAAPHDHRVFVTAALADDLRALYAARHDLRPGDCSADEPLIVGRHGKAMTVRQLENRIARWGRLAALPPGFSPHWLRHTRAMNIMRRSSAADPRGVVKAALGHESIRSSGVYTPTPREEVEAALTTVDGHRRIRLSELRATFEEQRA